MTSGPQLARRGRIVRLQRGTATTSKPAEALVAPLDLRRDEVRSLARRLPDVAELARLLAERLVGEALATSDEALAHFAEQLLVEARGARRMTLSCAPDDADRLARALATSDMALDVHVAPCADLHSGSLRLETDLGYLEASVESALEALGEAARSSPR